MMRAICNGMRFFFFICLFLVFTLQVTVAQTTRDSLESRLTQVADEQRVEILYQLARQLASTDPQAAIQYGNEALATGLLSATDEIAEMLFAKAQAYAALGLSDSLEVYAFRWMQTTARDAEAPHIRLQSLLLEGYLFQATGAYQQALAVYEQAMGVFASHTDPHQEALVHREMGAQLYQMGELERALEAYTQALSISEMAGDSTGVGKVLLKAGIVYDIMGDFEDALDLYTRALAIHERHGDLVGSGLALCNIGIFYDLIGEKDQALDYHAQSLELCERTGQALCKASAQTNMAAIYADQRQYREAINLYNEALEVFRSVSDTLTEAGVLNNLGQAYHQVRDVDRALSSYAMARRLYEAVDQPEGMASVLMDAGQLFRRQAHYEEALESLTRGVEIAEEIDSDQLLKQGYYELYLLHEGFGEHREALDAHKRFKAANDSLFNQENEAVLAELRTQFQSQEQQLRIQGLEQVRANQQRLLLILLSGLLLLSGLAIFAYRLYRQKSAAHQDLTEMHQDLQKTQQQLIHSEKMASLGQLTAGVAHEIRNPLNFIINFSKLNVELSDELLDEIKTQENAKVGDVAGLFQNIIQDLSFNAQKVNEHSHRAEGIVQSMLEHANATRKERVPTNLNEFVNEIVELAFYGVKQTERACEIKVDRKFDKGAGVYDLAPQELGRVLVNLFDNAIYAVCEKKTQSNGVYEPAIVVQTVAKSDHVMIRLNDNGPGMPQEVLDKIFEPFYSTKPTGKGTGLGLSLAYDIVTVSYDGEMVVRSEEGKGTTFEITLPR